jgi:branched-chain amino acid transport system substrate-binding protein
MDDHAVVAAIQKGSVAISASVAAHRPLAPNLRIAALASRVHADAIQQPNGEPRMSKATRKKIRTAALPALLIWTCLSSLPAAAQDCEVKLGTVGPMTGGGASWGLSEKAGVEFEAAWTNANGGLQVGNRRCKVTVVAVDGQATAAGGAAASNYFASQKVFAINGPMVGPENTGFKPVGKRNGQVSFSTTFALDAIGPEFPLAFHKIQGPPAWGGIVVKAAKDHFKFKAAALIGPNDQGGTDTVKPLVKFYKDAGVTTTVEYYQRGTTNFGPLATRVMNMNVDVVDFTGGPPGEMAILARQLLEAGFTGTFGRLGAGGDVIIKNSGGVAAHKAFYWFDHVPTEDPAIKRLSADFERLMKAPVPDNALVFNAQIAAENLLRAISLAGTDQDGEKIAAELRKMTPESRYLGKAGWRGKGQFGMNQEFSFPVGLSFISNGKIEKQLKLDIPAE